MFQTTNQMMDHGFSSYFPHFAMARTCRDFLPHFQTHPQTWHRSRMCSAKGQFWQPSSSKKVGHPELVAKTNHVSHAGKTWYFSFFLGIPRKEPVATDCMVCMVYNSTLPICWPHSGSFSILQPQASAFFRSFSAFASASFCRICRKISRNQPPGLPETQFQPWFLVRVKVYLYKCAWGLSEARLPFPSPNSGTKLITSTRNDLHEAGSTEFLYRKTLPSTRFSLSI